MKHKITFVLLLARSPFSIDVSISGGFKQARTDHHYYSDVLYPSEYSDYSTIIFKSDVTCFYKRTGIYVSADKLFGDDLFNRYFVFSGGIKQKIPFAGKWAFDMYLGTTWHTIDAAIHSVYEIFINTKVYSVPGLDTGIDLNYELSKKTSLFAGVNYNYNKQIIYSPPIGTTNIDRFYFRMISFSAGVMFSLL